MEEQEISDRFLNVRLYEGCGNRLLIVHLNGDFSRNDGGLRRELQRIGLAQNADSVLILTGDPEQSTKQGYHVTMDVFEPRGVDARLPELPGSWSTMCGNGIRAVARYLMDSSTLSCCIKTRSGIRKTNILPENQFRVCMGKFTTRRAHLIKYVRNFDFAPLIRNKIGVAEIFVGLNGSTETNGNIDGEPHLVIIVRNQGLRLTELQQLAESFGPEITTNRAYFPECINSNFVVVQGSMGRTTSVIACTFERGVEYVTQACGTGASVIGSYILESNTNIDSVAVSMPGGTLHITRGKSSEYYLTGSANPISL